MCFCSCFFRLECCRIRKTALEITKADHKLSKIYIFIKIPYVFAESCFSVLCDAFLLKKGHFWFPAITAVYLVILVKNYLMKWKQSVFYDSSLLYSTLSSNNFYSLFLSFFDLEIFKFKYNKFFIRHYFHFQIWIMIWTAVLEIPLDFFSSWSSLERFHIVF